MTTTHLAPHRNVGVALVTTLLVIVALAIIVTAFLQSMTIEHKTARSYLNRYKAELAAEAGLASLINKLVEGGDATDLHFTLNAVFPGTEEERVDLARQLGKSKEIRKIVPLASEGAGPTTRVRVVEDTAGSPAMYRKAAFVAVNDSDGVEIGRYAYWAEAATMKQNLWTGGGSSRDERAAPGDLPLIQPVRAETTNVMTVSAEDVASLRSKRASVISVKSFNQIAHSLTVPADDFDFSLLSPSEKLTPEGLPKLNLTRLKCYIDGGTYQEDRDGDGTVDFQVVYPGLDTKQGPTSPRFELIKRLLNESGDFPFEAENPWGPGNLEYLLSAYPEKVDGVQIEARQAVANLIDYIDADLVPTTDGQPGAPISVMNSDSSTGTHQRTFNPVSQEIPVAEIHPPPTVLGVEARYTDNGILGHPYINGVTVGFIMNPATGGTTINSTRILGGVILANPWSAPIRWKTGLNTGYLMEMQVKMLGGVRNGTRGVDMHVPNSSSGYFMNAWLAQYSGIVSSDFLNREIQPTSAIWFPKAWTSNLDLANGPYAINQRDIVFSDFGMQIEVLRLIYRDPTTGERYLVQDLRALKDMPRMWAPPIFQPIGGIFKLGGSPGIVGQVDWHLNGDPRLNFRKEMWSLVPSTFTTANFKSSNKVYSAPENPYKDGLQGLSDSSDWWNTAGKPYFPTKSEYYRPSPAPTLPAMKSYVELGYLAVGRPWQSLRLYKDNADPSQPNDIPLLELVDIGMPADPLEQRDNVVPNWRIDDSKTVLANGLINVATPKRASLFALLKDTKHLPDANIPALADAILNSPHRPFKSVSDIFLTGTVKNEGTTDAEKEMLAAQVVPLATNRSNCFTVYVAGETRRNGRTVSRVTLKAEVEIRRTASSGSPRLHAEIIHKEIL